MTAARPKLAWRRWYVAWPIALVVAAVVTPLAAMKVSTHATAAKLPPAGDRVSAAVAALRTDHFYVGPEVAHRLTAAQRSEIAQTLQSAKVPAYLVFWSSAGNQGYYIEPDALEEIMAGVGVDGHYAIVNSLQEVTQDSRGLTEPYIDADIVKQRIGTGLLDYAKAMAAAPAERESAPFDYWGGAGGGFGAGLLFVGLGFPVLLLVIWVLGVLVRRLR